MSTEGSVTHWLGRLQAGDAAAAQPLWERYFRRLVGLARQRLQNGPHAYADEEDVALSAFDSFCRAAEGGRCPQLADRDSLWRLLMTITLRKAQHLLRDQGRKKRSGPALPGGDGTASLEQILSREPSPAFAAQMAEEFRCLLDALSDKELASVAVWRMEGYTVEEIGVHLGCAPRSVKRKLQIIRTLWEREVTS